MHTLRMQARLEQKRFNASLFLLQRNVFLWVWHRPARPSTHNTWNGGNNNNGGVNKNQNTGGGNGGSNSWTDGNGNIEAVSNKQQGNAASPGKLTDSKAT